MFAKKVVLVALSALTFVTAQSSSNITIDANSVPAATRSQWCQAQTGTCLTLCNNIQPKSNDCNPTTLAFSCTCTDGTTPDVSKYVATIPSFVCEKAFEQCIAQNVGNASGQTACKNNIQNQCGTLQPSAASSGGSSSSSSAAASGTGTAAATTSSAAATSTSKAAAPTNLANGAAVAALGLFAALL